MRVFTVFAGTWTISATSSTVFSWYIVDEVDHFAMVAG
jgi:hypothetical protein